MAQRGEPSFCLRGGRTNVPHSQPVPCEVLGRQRVEKSLEPGFVLSLSVSFVLMLRWPAFWQCLFARTSAAVRQMDACCALRVAVAILEPQASLSRPACPSEASVRMRVQGWRYGGGRTTAGPQHHNCLVVDVCAPSQVVLARRRRSRASRELAAATGRVGVGSCAPRPPRPSSSFLSGHIPARQGASGRWPTDRGAKLHSRVLCCGFWPST